MGVGRPAVTLTACTPPREVAARVAVAWYFFVNGVIFSSWYARISEIQGRLRLDAGHLGAALLVAAAGTVIGLLWMERRLDRYGSHRVVVAAAVVVALGLVGLGLAGSLGWLMAGLLLFGLAGGVVNAAMNAQAVALDRVAQRPIITYFHALYSLGALIGAALGALSLALGIGVTTTFVLVGITAATVSAAAGWWVLPPPAVTEVPRRDDSRTATTMTLGSRILLVGLCCFACLMAEGIVVDWAGVYLRTDLGASPQLAPSGLIAFSVAMLIARIGGGRVTARFGETAVVRACALLAAGGMLLYVLAQTWVAGVFGLWFGGLGLACLTPQIFRWAGEGAAGMTGRAVARVAVFGYIGLLGGPSIVGSIAALVGLRQALGILVVLMLAAVALSAKVAPRRPRPSDLEPVAQHVAPASQRER
jgi:MFS family permease